MHETCKGKNGFVLVWAVSRLSGYIYISVVVGCDRLWGLSFATGLTSHSTVASSFFSAYPCVKVLTCDIHLPKRKRIHSQGSFLPILFAVFFHGMMSGLNLYAHTLTHVHAHLIIHASARTNSGLWGATIVYVMWHVLLPKS